MKLDQAYFTLLRIVLVSFGEELAAAVDFHIDGDWNHWPWRRIIGGHSQADVDRDINRSLMRYDYVKRNYTRSFKLTEDTLKLISRAAVKLKSTRTACPCS